jgi:phage host-nuclease inhibitor protein Gam
MSYSERYSATISGTEYYSHSYPASESGGSIEGSVHWSEDVDIEIYVDTSSFDHSVTKFKRHIDGLTGAVVATEAAQIEERVRGAKAISQSVTSGFFQLIGSEITQQMASLKSKVDSLILKLNDMKSACQRIQQTMQQDYHRITDRYTGIFEELDRELALRIASIDKSAYALNRDASAETQRSFNTTLSTVPTVFIAENSRTQGILTIGTLRSDMNELLQSAMAYLVSEKNTSNALSAMLMANDADDSLTSTLPVAYIATDGSPSTATERIVLPPLPGSLKDDKSIQSKILSQFRERNLNWKLLTSDDRDQIDRFFLPLVSAASTTLQDHDARVGKTIIHLWNADTPEVLSLQ